MSDSIHERLIARLEELRAIYPAILIDMALNDVRRRCPFCDDDPTARVPGPCPCLRPAYLAECERRLSGEK
jgi:hypothetical protein